MVFHVMLEYLNIASLQIDHHFFKSFETSGFSLVNSERQKKLLFLNLKIFLVEKNSCFLHRTYP